MKTWYNCSHHHHQRPWTWYLHFRSINNAQKSIGCERFNRIQLSNNGQRSERDCNYLTNGRRDRKPALPVHHHQRRWPSSARRRNWTIVRSGRDRWTWRRKRTGLVFYYILRKIVLWNSSSLWRCKGRRAFVVMSTIVEECYLFILLCLFRQTFILIYTIDSTSATLLHYFLGPAGGFSGFVL